MVQLSLPYNIRNDTPADAGPVDNNYIAIKDHINDHLINADGSVAMTAQLKLVGDPVNPTDAATMSYVDAILPVGVILPYSGLAAPAGAWAICNGANLPQTAYPKLYAVVQTRFGTAPAAGTFYLPDLRGRVPVGSDGGAYYTAVGKAGGTYTVPVPRHDHGTVASGPDSLTHTHYMRHDHKIDHNHALQNTGAPNQGHQHDLDLGFNSTPGTVRRAMAGSSAGTHDTNQTTSTDASTHTHALDINPYTGKSSAAMSGVTDMDQTGGQSSNHTHSVDIPAAGVLNIEQHQPYVTIVYIIRID